MEVISIEQIEDEDIVYDLETETGTFVAGGYLNGILVKNTDSCYVQFPINESDFENRTQFLEKYFELSAKCAEYCTKQFKPPIELAFEKVMYRLFLAARKRYAYIECLDPSKLDPNIHYKGVQLVRRDTCRYVKEELDNTFKIIMFCESKDKAKKEAIDYIKISIINLLNSNVDFNKLVLSKQLKSSYIVRSNKISNTYHWTNPNINMPHVRLAQQLKIKNPANHPTPPDRVPYIFIEKKGNNLLQCDKVIHPSDFNPLIHKIDSLYYFDCQFKKPIDMVFQFLLVDKNGNPDTEKIYKNIITAAINKLNGQPQASDFFISKNKVSNKISNNFKYIPDMTVEIDSDVDDMTDNL